MLLPNIQGNVNIVKDGFYFAADKNYFDLYGKALCLSLKEFAPWANVHVHLFNPFPTQLEWLRKNNVTASYETVDDSFKEIKTYYACVRFVRVPEIFHPDARVISIDADGVAVKPILKEKFLRYTETSKVLWREKQQQSLASSVIFGLDDFRLRYANKIKQHFLNDNVKWFLDQNILDEMIFNKEVSIFTERDWGNSKIGKNTLIWSAKGDKKNNEEFQKILNQYLV